MKLDGLGIGLSGIRAAGTRLRSSAHNVANLLTGSFHPERVVQQERATGGVTAQVQRSAQPQPVDLAGELVDQQMASLQGKASMRAIDARLDMLGSLLDIRG